MESKQARVPIFGEAPEKETIVAREDRRKAFFAFLLVAVLALVGIQSLSGTTQPSVLNSVDLSGNGK
jgi:hypothetical protein